MPLSPVLLDALRADWRDYRPRLWLFGGQDHRTPMSIGQVQRVCRNAVRAAGVETVVELADSEALAVLPRDLVRCRFPLSDGGDNPAWLLRLASESVAALLRAGVPTLVCCACGLSRSVCIAAGGVALAEDKPLDEALTLVAHSGPADVSPGLLLQVRSALGESAVPETH